jgi:cytochrome c5
MLALALSLSLTAAAASSDVRTSYEVKCLFCHSAEVAARPRLRPAQWRKVVEAMRRRAPLLISRRDVDVLTRYIVRDLKLVPPERSRPRAPRPLDAPPSLDELTEEEAVPLVSPDEEPPPASAKPPDPAQAQEAVSAQLAAASTLPLDEEAERLGPELLESKCSKCHTLQRVFLKVDTFERGTALIDRMRKKTGSGITRQDAELLLRFLRSRM